MIDNRKDILLLLLYLPGMNQAINEPISGRTRLVKMVFLFNKEIWKYFKKDVDLAEKDLYNFFPWNFGPFSKEVYEDINFFILRDFITVGKTNLQISNESVKEMNLWASDWEENEPNEYESFSYEEELKLTEKGEKFASKLYCDLTDNQKKILIEFKKKMQETTLRAILVYVYSNYPDEITKSIIKDKIL